MDLESRGRGMIHSYLKEGARVRVVRGPLTGCTGVLDRVNARRGRLVVNLNIFGKSVSVELDIEDVEAARPGKSL